MFVKPSLSLQTLSIFSFLTLCSTLRFTIRCTSWNQTTFAQQDFFLCALITWQPIGYALFDPGMMIKSKQWLGCSSRFLQLLGQVEYPHWSFPFPKTTLDLSSDTWKGSKCACIFSWKSRLSSSAMQKNQSRNVEPISMC